MLNYATVAKEIQNELDVALKTDKSINPIQKQITIDTKLNEIRVKSLNDYAKIVNRNVVCYHSSYLQSNLNNPEFAITENDMNGFVSVISDLNKNKGLDLIIQTPGGSLAATESIVEYLKKEFNNDIRVIVPHLCMSAGTMIACAAKEILMLPQSSLGPFDPQYRGIPAQGIIEEFEEAIKDVEKNSQRALIWREIIGKYPPAL